MYILKMIRYFSKVFYVFVVSAGLLAVGRPCCDIYARYVMICDVVVF